MILLTERLESSLPTSPGLPGWLCSQPSIMVWVGNSLVVQWLGLGTFTAWAQGPGSIPGRGAKILQTVSRAQKNSEC